MYPTKSTIDYTMEINRLFQNSNENDIFNKQTNSLLSPFNNSTVNRSSSSTDSISPESFPDISPRGYTESSVFSQQEFMPTETDSPFRTHRHRPIIGRRLMTTDQTPTLQEENSNYFKWDLDVSIWQPSEVISTPLNNNNILTENENKPNTYYELFPENNTPIKTSNISPSRITNSPNHLTISPNHMTNSPSHVTNLPCYMTKSPSRLTNSPKHMTNSPNHMTNSPSHVTNLSSYMTNSPSHVTNLSSYMTNSPSRMTNSPNHMSNSPIHMSNSPSLSNMTFLEPLLPNQCQTQTVIPNSMLGSSSSKLYDTGKVCTFCRKNGETPLVYTTHVVKQRVGNKQIVTCPILRSHVCSTCGLSGDQAHTITYCPVLRNGNNGQPLLSTTITLKNTRVKSNGRRRY